MYLGALVVFASVIIVALGGPGWVVVPLMLGSLIASAAAGSILATDPSVWRRR